METLAAVPWRRFRLNDEEWMIKFVRCGASYSIAISDAKSNVWYEHVPAHDASAKVAANLSNVEAQPDQIFEKIESFLWKALESNDVSCSLSWESPDLKLSANMVLFVFKWSFSMTSSHPHTTCPVYDYVTKPFMEVAAVQTVCVGKLIDALQEKEKEVQELRRLLPADVASRVKNVAFDTAFLETCYGDVDVSQMFVNEHFQRAFKSLVKNAASLPPDDSATLDQSLSSTTTEKISVPPEVPQLQSSINDQVAEVSLPQEQPQLPNEPTTEVEPSQPPAPPSLKVYEADANKKKKKRKLI